jgi:hypothetical protein
MISTNTWDRPSATFKGERNVARQLQVVDALGRDSHDTGEPMILLVQFVEPLAMCIADRARLRRQLGPQAA